VVWMVNRDAAAAEKAKRDKAVMGNSYRPKTARAASLHTQEVRARERV
jgi:hypothetical protein